MYDYREAIWEDILKAMDEICDYEPENVDNEADGWAWILQNNDSVTGNLSGSYTMSTYKAMEYVTANIELAEEVIIEYDVHREAVYNWEYIDVLIRCHLVTEELLAEIMDTDEYKAIVAKYKDKEVE